MGGSRHQVDAATRLMEAIDPQVSVKADSSYDVGKGGSKGKPGGKDAEANKAVKPKPRAHQEWAADKKDEQKEKGRRPALEKTSVILEVPAFRCRDIIGPQGSVVKGLRENTGADIIVNNPNKGKGKDGKGKDRNDDLTVKVTGLSWELSQETVEKDFKECGEVTRVFMPKNEEGKPKGFAFIEYKDEAGVKKALEFNEQEYSGRTIYVCMAEEAASKGKGKDGKKDGKGKDGKGNGRRQ